jgi:hypothetical protein
MFEELNRSGIRKLHAMGNKGRDAANEMEGWESEEELPLSREKSKTSSPSTVESPQLYSTKTFIELAALDEDDPCY